MLYARRNYNMYLIFHFRVFSAVSENLYPESPLQTSRIFVENVHSWGEGVMPTVGVFRPGPVEITAVSKFRFWRFDFAGAIF